jgi:glycogen synthase
MAKDFSWKGSAKEYEKVYAAALASRNRLPVATSN